MAMMGIWGRASSRVQGRAPAGGQGCSKFFCVVCMWLCVVCRYSALSGVADVSEAARNRSIGRSVGGLSSSVAGREYPGRMSGPSSRSSLTPRSSQEKNSALDATPLTAARYYNSCSSSSSK